MFHSLKKVFSHKVSFIIWGITSILAFVLWYYYSDIEYVAANYRSYGFAYFDTFLSWMMIIFFPLIIAAIVYKALIFGKRNIHKKSGILGMIGGLISTFITGCVCCGVSLLSVLGLSSFIVFLEVLPYDGIELKVLAIFLLIYATYDTYKNLEVCKINR